MVVDRLTTNFDRSPYWNDYDANNDFHSVLFRPSRAVQVRELNQLQSYLQEQVARFGDNVLREGTIIEGVDPRLETPRYVKLNDLDSVGQTLVVGDYANTYFRGATSNTVARVIHTIQGSVAAAPNLNTILVDYVTSGNDGENPVFLADEVLDHVEPRVIDPVSPETEPTTRYDTAVSPLPSAVVAPVVRDPIGLGTRVTVGDGLVYTKGHFLRVAPHFVVVDRYSTTPSKRIGFDVVETLITSVDDTTLLDNASGTNNVSAPGADRLRLVPRLVANDIDAADPENVENLTFIMEIINGEVRRVYDSTIYDGIDRELATRTFEESGNYVVQPMTLDVREHIGTDGVANSELLSVTVSKGTAYVDGYRSEFGGTAYLDMERGTDTDSVDEAELRYAIGNYVRVASGSFRGQWNPTTYQTVTILSNVLTSGTPNAANVIGTAKLRHVSVEADGSFRFYLFDIEMTGGSFSEARSLYASTPNRYATISLTNGAAVLEDGDRTTAIVDTGVSFVSGVSNVEITERAAASITITGNTTTVNDVAYGNTSGASLDPDEVREFIVVNDNSGARIVVNSVVVDGTRTATLSFTGVTNGQQATVYYNRILVNEQFARKNLATARYVRLTGSATNPTGPWNLGTPDVWEIEEVRVYPAAGQPNAPANTHVDLIGAGTDRTRDFVLDRGTRDDLYEHSGISLRNGRTAITEDEEMLVRFSRFDVSSGRGFFSVDSYDGQIPVEEIPRYSSEDGRTFDLRNCLDLRPRVTATASNRTNPEAHLSSIDPATSASVNTTASRPIVPGTDIELDIEYNLGRVDRVYITGDGARRIKRGNPSTVPSLPQDDAQGMTIGFVHITPFPSLTQERAVAVDRPELAVRVTRRQQKGYSMSDISRLERRLDRLEYYTSLNVLEKSARDLVIRSSDGLDRFKNGIFVDRFFSHALGATTDPAYMVSVDKVRGEIRPIFEQYSVDTGYVASGSTVQQTGEVLTVPYTESTYVGNGFATKTRNPVGELLFNWVGRLDLTPEADHWVDTTRVPDVQQEIDLTGHTSGRDTTWTEWGSWNTVSSRSNDREREFSTTARQGFIETTRNFRETTTITTEADVRRGTRFNIEPFTETFRTGPFVRNVEVVPFVRSRAVSFVASDMKPNTRVYPYFDDVPVSQWCRPRVLRTDANGSLRGTFVIPAGEFRVGERRFRLIDAADLTVGASSITTSAAATYNASGLDVSSQGITVTTRNTRVVEDTVTDSRSRSFTSQAVDLTSTDTVDRSPPIRAAVVEVATPRPTRPSTRRPIDPIAQSFFVGTQEVVVPANDDGIGLDVDGLFVTSVDLYFARKPTNSTLGITVEIREMVNGAITRNSPPFARRRLDPSRVGVSSDASVATRFTFPSPVYLRGNNEYAIVVKPQGSNADYLLWVSELGGIDVTDGTRVVEQPANGVLFTSANDLTYTPRQNEDLKFTVRRAVFETNTDHVANFTNLDVDYLTVGSVGANGFEVGETVRGLASLSYATTGGEANTGAPIVGDTLINGDGTIRFVDTVGDEPTVYIDTSLTSLVPNDDGDLFEHTDGTAYDLNGTFVASSTTGTVESYDDGEESLVLEDSDGGFVANTAVYAEQSDTTARLLTIDDLEYELISPKISEAVYGGCTSEWSYVGTTKSGTGAYTTANRRFLENHVDNDVPAGLSAIRSRSAEGSANKSFEMRATLRTTNDRVSPVVDHGRSTSLIAVHSLVNNVTDTGSETTNFGDATSRYVSKRIALADGQDAEDLRVYVTAYRPAGTNVYVYGRFQAAGDREAWSEQRYTLMTEETEGTFSSVTDRDDLVELEFAIPTGTAAASTTSRDARLDPTSDDAISYINSADVVFNTFKFFSVKIVFSSPGSALVPRVSDLRVIALQA